MKFEAGLRMVLGALACLLWLPTGPCVVLGLEPSANMVELHLHPATQVKGPDILLKQIADVRCSDPQQLEKLRQLAVAKSPLPGRSRQLRSKYVQLRLRQFGFDPEHVKLSGARTTVVTARSMEVKEAEVRRIAADFVHKANLWGTARVTITDIQVGSDRLFPPGRLSYRVIPPKGPKQIGMLRLAVLFEVDGWFRKSIPAVVRIAVLTDVVVARRPIGRYKPISEKDVKLQRQDLTDLPAHIFTDLNEVIGKRSKRMIQANTVLRHDMIETPPLVHRGSMVLIVAESGGLKVTTVGEVKSSGYLGQRVKVVNLDSKKKIFARVVDENTVRVDF